MENKKRIRPTLGQVRALEAEVAELREKLQLEETAQAYVQGDVRQACSDVSELRSMNENQKKQIEEAVSELEKSNAKVEKLVAEVKTLKQEKKSLSSHLGAAKKRAVELSRKNDDFSLEVLQLRVSLSEKGESLADKEAEFKILSDNYRSMECEKNALESSNSLMESELERLRDKVRELSAEVTKRDALIKRLENRGIIARLFNKF